MNIKLKNVRLSYPNLFEPKSGPEGGEAKYSAAFLMDKDNNEPEITAIRDAVLAVAKGQWGDQNVKWNNGQLAVKKADGKAAIVKICLRSGEEKPDTTGYENVMFFSASNKMSVPIVDKNPSIALTKQDGKPYAGCLVNVSVRLWAQDNNFGRRVNAQLQAVQFAGEGESFGDAPVNPESVFDNIADGSAKSQPSAGADSEEDSGIPF